MPLGCQCHNFVLALSHHSMTFADDWTSRPPWKIFATRLSYKYTKEGICGFMICLVKNDTRKGVVRRRVKYLATLNDPHVAGPGIYFQESPVPAPQPVPA